MSEPGSPERPAPDTEAMELSPETDQGDTPKKGRKKKGEKKPIPEMKLTVDVQQWLRQENGKAVKVKIADLRVDKTKERGQIRSINYDDVARCKVSVQPIFSLFSVQNPDICTPTENHDPSTVLDSVGISGSGISVVLHSWCFHHFLYNKTEFGSATASPEIARAGPEIVDF